MAEQPAESAKKSAQGFGWILFAIIVAAIIASSQCTDTPTSTLSDNSSSDVSSVNADASQAANATTPVSPLDPGAVRRGVANFGLVDSAGFEGGFKIYSENCYEALAKEFAWRRLDRCGGFDTAAVRAADNGSSTFTADEITYFDSETAAGRYLAAAAAAGEEPGEADLRYSQLGVRALKARSFRIRANKAHSADQGRSDPVATAIGDSDASTTIDDSRKSSAQDVTGD